MHNAVLKTIKLYTMKNSNTTTEDNKKKLITETVTGRRLTPGRIVKYALLAAVCGIAFGAGSELAKNALDALYHAVDTETSDEYAQETESVSPDDENAPASDDSESDTPVGAGTKPDQPAAPARSDDTTESDAASDSTTLIDADTINQAYLSIRSDTANAANDSLVTVTVTAQTNTWFDNEMESSDTYSGVILSIDDSEILILTPYINPDGKSIKVSFNNGSSADAQLKQNSSADQLSVIAVSASDGISGDTLGSIEAIGYGDISGVQKGTPVIAVGSPLGVPDSCSFGTIGYVSHSEMSIDCQQLVFYSDLCGNATKGTFIIDYDGKLIGVVSSEKSDIASSCGYTRIVGISSLDRTLKLLMSGVKKAYLGIYGMDVDFDMKYSSVPEGAYVYDVITGSPAYNAGIRHGDVITGISDRAVTDAASLSRALAALEPGIAVSVSIKRGSVNSEYKELKSELVLGER